MKITDNHITAVMCGEPVSRRIKKAVIGKKMKKSKLKMLLKNSFIVEHKYPEAATIFPKEFCPKCGCEWSESVNHGVEYPECWITFYCVRCRNEVASIDNSPYMHVLLDILPKTDCSESCPCKNKNKSIEDHYWKDIVPNQFLASTGIHIPVEARYNYVSCS